MPRRTKGVGSGNYERKFSAEVLCKVCGVTKPRTSEHFFLASTGALRDGCCKLCKSQVARRYREANKEKIKVKKAAEYLANQEKMKATSAARYATNKADILKAEKERRSRPEQKEKRNERQRARRKTDPGLRLNRAMSNRIRQCLRGGKRGGRWIKMVGYTVIQLKAHLERQFVRKMTWENYGHGWHVDHIQPISSFDIRTLGDEEFRACWAITNLRPLWKIANIRKGPKREFLL